MSTPLTSAELSIISDLLRESSNEYSNHGCNDYYIANTEENKTMLVALIKDSFSKEDQEEEIERIMSCTKKKLLVMDWLLMDYLAARCEEVAK